MLDAIRGHSAEFAEVGIPGIMSSEFLVFHLGEYARDRGSQTIFLIIYLHPVPIGTIGLTNLENSMLEYDSGLSPGAPGSLPDHHGVRPRLATVSPCRNNRYDIH